MREVRAFVEVGVKQMDRVASVFCNQWPQACRVTFEVPMTPRYIDKQAFGRRLYQLMTAKGWTQSELARRANITRDAVSTYVRGKTMPTRQSANALAEALGVQLEELLPNFIPSANEIDDPALEIKTIPGSPGKASLRINQIVPLDVAIKISQILSDNQNAAPADKN